MSKKIAISQSNYIPWKGYFDFINQVDEFVLYDDVQYTDRDWRNRNKVKTPHGVKWLSIPVKACRETKINEVVIADENWNRNHWKTIYHLYRQAPCFDFYAEEIEILYKMATQPKLSDINFHFLMGITELLEIKTPFSRCTEYDAIGGPSERLVSICQQADADIYLTGPAAKNYLDVALFEEQGIEVEWVDYNGYEEYPQIYGEYESGVTILDLLFNTGENAANHMKSFNYRGHERAEYFAHSTGSEVY